MRILDKQDNDLSKEECLRVLSLFFGKSGCSLEESTATITVRLSQIPNTQGEIQRLLDKVEEKDRELRRLEENLEVALESIKSFHEQQKSLFDEFVTLRSRYDKQKKQLQHIFWEYLPAQLPHAFGNIPKLQNIAETETSVDEWEMGGAVGDGQFATVREVTGSDHGSNLVIKRIDKSKINSLKSAIRVNSEIAILKELNHPNVIRLIETLHSEGYIYLIQERGGIDLFEYFRRNRKPLTEDFAQVVLQQLFGVISHLHKHRIIHRDLKPENILIDDNFFLKVIDFGLGTKNNRKFTSNDFCGTPGFFAPEMILVDEYNGDKVDIWSAGCILLEMYLGHSVFQQRWMSAYKLQHFKEKSVFAQKLNESLKAVMRIVEEGREALSYNKYRQDGEQQIYDFSEAAKDLLLKLLYADSNRRLSIEQVLGHPWIKSKHRHAPSVPKPTMRLQHLETTVEMESKKQESVDELIPRINSSSLLEKRSGDRNLRVSTKPLSSSDSRARERLPPLSPGTPSMEEARNILKLGESTKEKTLIAFSEEG